VAASNPLRVAAVLATVVATCTPAGCGSNGGGRPGCQEKCAQGGGPAGPLSPGAPTVRLGCGPYCQQAGPGAGPPEPGAPSLRIETSGAARPAAGAIPIEVRCLLPRPCQGRIVIFSDLSAKLLARSDLDIPAMSTRTFAVSLTPAGDAEVRAQPRQRAIVRANDGLSLSPRSASCPLCHGPANEAGRWSGQIDQQVVLAAP
jgi:hypothetical protein